MAHRKLVPRAIFVFTHPATIELVVSNLELNFKIQRLYPFAVLSVSMLNIFCWVGILKCKVCIKLACRSPLCRSDGNIFCIQLYEKISPIERQSSERQGSMNAA